MAAARRVAWAPWRQPLQHSPQPGPFGAGPGYASSLQREARATVVEGRCTDTLFESKEGELVSAEAGSSTASGAEACALLRCCAFAPEPGSQAPGGEPASKRHFRRCQQVAHVAVRPAPVPAACGGLPGLLRRWGLLGAVVGKLVQGESATDWIAFEHQVLSVFFAVLALVAEMLRRVVAVLTASAPAEKGCSSFRSPLGRCMRTPAMAWHPHRDMLATLSREGTVAVHSIGSTLDESATHYLHADRGALGDPLCLEWQPNDLSGALALGFSRAVAVWRRSPRGWFRTWCMSGEAFACPAVAWSPDGRCLAAAGDRGVVRVWPHDALASGHGARWCVTLRRWRGGAVAAVRWAPDGALLAVAHGGRQPFVRLWDASSWEVALHVAVGGLCPPDTAATSLAWCGGQTLVGAGGGQLFELSGLAASCGRRSAALARGAACRALATPHVRAADAPVVDTSHQAVVEVAICPRTAQRVAVRAQGSAHVLLFERLGTEGWARQELAFRGLIGAAAGASDGPSPALPLALAFADNPPRRAQREPSVEGSLLAVYWDLGEQGAEVRTYPMHFLPYKLMQSDASVVFD